MIFLNVNEKDGKYLVKIFTKNKKDWGRGIAMIKAIPNARFNAFEKVWSIPATDDNYGALQNIGVIRSGEVSKSKEVSVWSRCPLKFRDWAKAPESQPTYDIKDRQRKLIDSIELTGTVIKGLRNYQIDFLKFCDACDGRVILGDDMGTGKTCQSLSWLAYSNDFPALIVVNAPTKLQWEKEYNRWLDGIEDAQPVQVIYGKTPRPLYAGSTVIINWDILTYWVPVFKKYGFKCIIGDEAQAVGNPNSGRGKAFLELSKYIPHCIVMSGTPARSRPSQYWTMIKSVAPNSICDYLAYQWRYCAPKNDRFSTSVTFDGASNMTELHYKLSKFMLRRTKDEVMTELPTKSIEVVPLDVVDSQEYIDDEKSLFETTRNSEIMEIVRNLSRSAFAMKADSLKKWVNNLLEICDEKLVIFCWHRSVVEVLLEMFSNFNPAKIYGGMSLKERECEKDRFISDEQCRIMIGNIQALGTGVDGLQKVCCKAVFAEFPDNATDLAQACDRLHRSGQNKQVTIYYTVAKGTIDEKIAKVLDTKKQMLDHILDGKETESFNLITEMLKNF